MIEICEFVNCSLWNQSFKDIPRIYIYLQNCNRKKRDDFLKINGRYEIYIFEEIKNQNIDFSLQQTFEGDRETEKTHRVKPKVRSISRNYMESESFAQIIRIVLVINHIYI